MKMLARIERQSACSACIASLANPWCKACKGWSRTKAKEPKEGYQASCRCTNWGTEETHMCSLFSRALQVWEQLQKRTRRWARIGRIQKSFRRSPKGKGQRCREGLQRWRKGQEGQERRDQEREGWQWWSACCSRGRRLYNHDYGSGGATGPKGMAIILQFLQESLTIPEHIPQTFSTDLGHTHFFDHELIPWSWRDPCSHYGAPRRPELQKILTRVSGRHRCSPWYRQSKGAGRPRYQPRHDWAMDQNAWKPCQVCHRRWTTIVDWGIEDLQQRAW